MCGLIGCTGSPGIDGEEILDRIAHRGPDGRGGYPLPGGGFLGHTRLAIQDVGHRADQPYAWGQTVLTYNGEVWNAPALRVNVEESGAATPQTWESTGDTEAVAAVLDTYGPHGLDLLDGMFAVAWFNQDSEEVWVARDRWGKVPLYLAESLEGTWWASEIKALDGIPAEPVQPGTAVNLTTGRVVRWATGPAWKDPLEDPAEVQDLLGRGVRKRLLSERPVCFLLSGGLDSALTLALARDHVTDPVAYHAVHDPASPDLVMARVVASHLDVPLVEVPVPPVTRQAVVDSVRAIEVPMKAQVEIALGCLPLARAIASDGFRVVLSGEAADEVFGGYGGMAIKAARADDAGWQEIRQAQVEKMARGNFVRLNKVFMAAGVEARVPFMERELVERALATGKAGCPPGKGLLKAAARGLLPDRVIDQTKRTFQGGAGLDDAARVVSAGVVEYNRIARELFNYLPRG